MSLEELLGNPGLQLLGMLVATLGLSYAANYWLSRVFVGKTYRYLVAPGVIVHEYSHALACLVTGARVRSISVFDPRGGQVVHEPPKLAGGQGLISLAPILGAAVVLYLLARVLVPGFVGYGELELSSWQFLLFAYLAGSIAATMAPSTQDLKAGLVSFLVLCAIVGLTAVSELAADYFGFLIGSVYDAMRNLVGFALVVLAVLAATSGLFYFGLQQTSRRGTRYRLDRN